MSSGGAHMRVHDGISMVVRILSASEGRPTKEDMDERACRLAAYMIETGATVRSAAQKFGISKSTVHKDLTQRLEKGHPLLYHQVRQVLDRNKQLRHIRGGLATRRKYKGE